jgi:glucose-1-phosphate thymidylyltransferase
MRPHYLLLPNKPQHAHFELHQLVGHRNQDVNKVYLEQNKLQVKVLDSGITWLDTGTFTSLMQAAQFVQVLQDRQGLSIGAIEDVALQMGYINQNQYHKLISLFIKSGYANQ